MQQPTYLLNLAHAAANAASEADPRMTEKDYLDTHDAITYALTFDHVEVRYDALAEDVATVLRELPALRKAWREQQERNEFLTASLFGTLLPKAA